MGLLAQLRAAALEVVPQNQVEVMGALLGMDLVALLLLIQQGAVAEVLLDILETVARAEDFLLELMAPLEQAAEVVEELLEFKGLREEVVLAEAV